MHKLKKRALALFAFCVLFALSTFPVLASPIINEFSSATSADWVEIYNSGVETVDLSQYRLRDLTSTNKLDLSGSLAPSGFASFDWSNKLNNAGDLIKLVLISDESIIDQVTYGDQGGISAPTSAQTGGRKSDGSGDWVILSASSKGASNNSSDVFSPPTATPTKTTTPTKIPTPTKTTTKTSGSQGDSIPTKNPTPTKTIALANAGSESSEKSKKSVTIAHNFKIASDFARMRNISKTPGKKADNVEVLGAKEQNFSPLIILGGFVLLIAAAWFGRDSINYREIYEKIFNK